MMKVVLISSVVCAILLVQQSRAQGSNCAIGAACNRCPEGEYKVLTLGTARVKVCCSDCGTYFRAGRRSSDGRPYCNCDSEISGTCWVGDQCTQCLAGPNAGYVGRINNVPVCCANCERSGLSLSPSSCNCLHNGP